MGMLLLLLKSMLPLLLLLIIVAAIAILAYFIANERYKKSTYYQVTHNPYLAMRRDVGKYGEYLIYTSLRHMEQMGAKFLANVYVPKENNETTEIDVLLICSKGLFVFESKNYSGWIFGNENQRMWMQALPAGRGRSHKECFYNPIMQNRAHIKWLKSLIGEDVPMHSVIVFSQRCTLKNVTLHSQDVCVINRQNIVQAVSAICQRTPGCVVSEEKANAIYAKLYPYTQVDEALKAQHVANIQKRVSPAAPSPVPAQRAEQPSAEAAPAAMEHAGETAAPAALSNDGANAGNQEKGPGVCPHCGGKLVVRTARKGQNAGGQFWGCSNYPACKYIQNIAKEAGPATEAAVEVLQKEPS